MADDVSAVSIASLHLVDRPLQPGAMLDIPFGRE
jgi:hypothetical protein